MHNSLQDIIAIGSGFFVTLLLSLFLTRKAIKILPVFGLVDSSSRDDRRAHTGKVVTSGGIAMFLAFTIGSLLTCWLILPKCCLGAHIIYPLIPAAFVVILGVFDDKYEFKAKTKLIIQILAGILCFMLGFRIEFILGLAIPVYFSFVITLVWVLACINGFNLIDGIDGLAAGLGVISALTMGIFLFSIGLPESSMIMFLLCASCLGFLRYNFKDAKIFMGEAGSGFIGVTFAVVSISSSGKFTTISLLLVPLLAFGVPFFDTILAIFRRSLKKLMPKIDGKTSGAVFTADKEHIHHRLVVIFKNQRKATILLYLVSIVVCSLSLCLVFVQDYNQFTVVLTLVVVVVIIAKALSFLETRALLDLILSLTRKPKFLNSLVLLDKSSDFIIVGFVAYISNYLFLSDINKTIVGVCISLVCFGLIYVGFNKLRKIYWAKSTMAQYFYLIKALITFSLLMLVLDYYLFGRYMHFYSRDDVSEFIGKNLLNFSLVLLLMLAKKLAIKWVGDVGISIASSVYQGRRDNKKTLIYGTDILISFFRTELIREKANDTEIVGIITDNPVLKSKIVYGYKVLGGLLNIDSMVKKYSINSVLIASTSSKTRDLAYLVSYCRKNKIALKWITMKEDVV